MLPRSTSVRAAVTGLLLAGTVAGCSGDGADVSAPPARTTTAMPTTTASTDPAPPASGGTSPAPSGSPTPSPSAGRTPSPDRCHTGELAVAFGPPQAGAGQRTGVAVVTNTGGRTCTVFGYGGLQVLDAQRRPLTGNPLTRAAAPAPVLLQVPPGGVVHKDIRFTVVPTGAQRCPTPAYAQVTPPDETDHRTVAWPYGPVCGPIEGRAYRQGAGD